jgi:type IV secretion system protein VirD4
VEDSILLLGPPRFGQGQSVVIPTILDAPGAVITTSTRPDNLAVTFSARDRRGDVVVFDPQGLARAPGLLPTLPWSPIRGCERPQTALARAETLVADASRSGLENASFWRTQTVTAVRCLLHAAALAECSPADLYRWSHAAPAAKEAISILAQHRFAACGWDRALDAIVGADERMRDSTWAMVANTFSPLADPAVLEAVSPSGTDQFDPANFLTSGGMLYLLSTASGASGTANLVAALAEDVIEVARQLAAASAGGRLDLPLAVVLDEAANYPLPRLPALMSEGGGPASPPWRYCSRCPKPGTAGAARRPAPSGTPPSSRSSWAARPMLTIWLTCPA